MAALSSLCNLWSAKTTDSLPTDDQLFVRAIEHGVLALGHQEARPLQSDAAKAVLRGRDTFLNVPTGYGKSLTYQILPMSARFLLDALEKDYAGVPSVLIVSPLVALMYDQAQKLLNVDDASVLVLSDAVQLHQGCVKGHTATGTVDSARKCTHIFACPEAILHSYKWRKLLLDTEFVNSLVALVIDEAHCIVKW